MSASYWRSCISFTDIPIVLMSPSPLGSKEVLVVESSSSFAARFRFFRSFAVSIIVRTWRRIPRPIVHTTASIAATHRKPKTTLPARRTGEPSPSSRDSAMWKPAQNVESRYQHIPGFAENLIDAPLIIAARPCTAPLGRRGSSHSRAYSMCAARSFVVELVASSSAVTSMTISTPGHSLGSV